jgi:hypothetical protein
LKPAVVAGPPNAAPAQAVVVPADTIREFLKANGVKLVDGAPDAKIDASTGTGTDAKASVVRVICVRK